MGLKEGFWLKAFSSLKPFEPFRIRKYSFLFVKGF